jgi:tetratricopeptide (TPR) repeat protein
MLLCLALAAGWVTAHGQKEPLAQPAPFWPRTPAAPPGPGISLELDARRALNLGLSSVAAELYQKIYDDPATSALVRQRVAVDLATALIEEDRVAEAGAVLQKLGGVPTAPARLRLAMVAIRERRFEAARAEIQAIVPEELSPIDRGWIYFLRGQLADEARDPKAASAHYQQAYEAASAAGLEAQRAWFLLASQRLKLQAGNITDRDITVWRRTLENNPASPQAYIATSQLAVGLTYLGQRAEAIAVLQKALLDLPRQERALNDEWQLLLGLIAGAEESAGRVALRNLLRNSTDRDRQRIALRLLAQQARGGSRREEFRAQLDELIAAPSPHPILEYLLLFRAQTAIAEAGSKRYSDAETDAGRLLAEFPGSPLRAAAHGVLTESAWEQGRYRLAASQASLARELLPAGETRAQLGVLVAEAYFRAAEIGRAAADYRTAADAYGAALADVPAGIAAGDLMFQRVLAVINAGELDDAETLLDTLSRDPRLDVKNRWQSEWNLARAFQVAGASPKAYARINRLLGNAVDAAAIPGDLRVSMAWLQALLSLENNEPLRTLELTESLANSLEGVGAPLKTEIASNTLLLQARAGFALKDKTRTEAAMNRLRKLRADYPQSDAAMYSYIVEADAADAEGLPLEAQRFVTELADKFPQSEFAPYARYQAALYAERRGSDRQYDQEAYNILEQLVTAYPEHDLVFYARLKQGNLLRQMNDYGRALTLYATLVNRYKFPQHADALSAELALADTEAALAASDLSRASNASSLYERLYDLPAAPLDLRVEAGHKLGLIRAERESPERARAVWWQMIETFLRDDAKAERLGANGRYWMSRTLLKFGALMEAQSKPREARVLYELLLEKKLPGIAQANEGLQRTGGRPPATAPSAAP